MKPAQPEILSTLPSTIPFAFALDIASLSAAYRAGSLSPVQVVDIILERLAVRGDDPSWIVLRSAELLRADAELLAAKDPASLPLYGIPFAVKDNIDVAGMPTTAACPEFAYTPVHSAAVVQRLQAAGALLIGKTNLDQFATGLVGVRSPYGAVPNSFNPAYISGGSSSGSATVVANGLVSFALGTDTAGSGRVPAAFNNIVGLKPSCGLLSTRGVVPACRTLDCVSIFAQTVEDAACVLRVAAAYDPEDAYSRKFALDEQPFSAAFRFAVPEKPEFFGDAVAQAHFNAAVTKLTDLGGKAIPIDFVPFFEVAALLYDGAWVAERYAAIRDFFDQYETAVNPTVRAIIASAHKFDAAAAFEGMYRLQALKKHCLSLLGMADVLVVPSTPTIYTTAAVNADPIRLNSNLGIYTNFVNLLDLAAIAVPVALRSDGLPAGITLIAPAGKDMQLAALATRIQRAANSFVGVQLGPLPAASMPAALPNASNRIRVAVVGAHLSGMPLNIQLTERDAKLLRTCKTAAAYRLFALPDTKPPKPGLRRCAMGETGAEIDVEVWEMGHAEFGSFVGLIPPPLGIGTLELEDGDKVKGFICEPWALDGATEITHFGGWRAYMKHVASSHQ